VVDELLLYLAPKLLGQGMGIAALGPLASLDAATALNIHSVERVGTDLRIIARTAQSIF
jgi:diaminohydroxyphosphoribosylaminopyrimidine deaminase/5-amino-6-(5-phosphoribosylamino)uracil reductase